jgi:predicted ATPase
VHPGDSQEAVIPSLCSLGRRQAECLAESRRPIARRGACSRPPVLSEHLQRDVAPLHRRLRHLLWLLGEPGRARAAAREARSRAEQLGHPFMLSFAMILGASDHLYERDLENHLACVERGIEVARARGLSIFEVFGPLWGAEAIVAREPTDKALDRLSRNLDQLLDNKMYLQAPVYQALLATQYMRMGHYQQAKVLTDAAARLLKRTGEKWFEPELYRITGEIAASAKRPDRTAAEAHFKKALYLARRMRAVGWELRAAHSLAELRRQNGKFDEIGRIVRGVCDKYPRGQSCADLRECRAISTAALRV